MEFTALFEFIERFGSEVNGRNIARPTDEHAERFERFVQGKASAEEREQLCELLKDNPVWLRWLATRIKESNAEDPDRGR